MPSSQIRNLIEGRAIFCELDIFEQVKTLMQIIQLYKTNRAGGCDLLGIGGVAKAGVLSFGTKFSSLKDRYSQVCLVDMDFTGIYSKKSINLLELI